MGSWSSSSFGGNLRVMVFIDGGYIRQKFIDKYNNDKIKYYQFAEWLTDCTQSAMKSKPQLIRAFYYDGMPDVKDLSKFKDESEEQIKKRREKIESKQKTQEEYLDRIELTEFFDVKRGRLVMKEDGNFGQKGIDSLIAIDMISKAYQNQYDIAVLVTGDSDFKEVVEAVKHAGPIVFGAYFHDRMPLELIRTFDRRIEMDNYKFNNMF